MKHFFLLLALGIFSGSALSAPELKGSPQDLRGFLYPKGNVVTLQGHAEQKAYSDQAIVSLVISTENKLLSLAIADNSALRAELLSALTAAGIPPEAINSSKFSSSPQYGWFGDKPSSFKVVNRMAVKIKQESHLQKIAAVADKYQQVTLSDTAFEHSKKDEYKRKVKAEALAKITEQKTFYETSLGVKLSPIGIRDSNIRQRATRGAMVLEEVMVTASRRVKSSNAPAVKYQQQAKAPSFDEVKYEANLAVDFKIEQ